MSYFDRRQDESIRYCPVCERRTMHTRPGPVALWTCQDSGHPHPTKQQQEHGMKTNDNFDSEIRHAVGVVLIRHCDGECVDRCTCHARTRAGLVATVKSRWRDHAVYPTNMRIVEVLEAMVREGMVSMHTGCAFYDCTDDEGQSLNHQPQCISFRWAFIPAPFITVDGEEIENPAEGQMVAPDREWSPSGERLRVDKRGYSPRQTMEELRAFYEDRESLPRYDPETRTYIRDDLPPMFDCGCSRPKVLAGKCDLFGPDGRERGWLNPQSAVFVGSEGQSVALATNRYGDKGEP